VTFTVFVKAKICYNLY